MNPLGLPVRNGPRLHHEQSPDRARCRHDIALLAEDGDCFQDPTLNLAREVEKVRLCVSAEKSKIMHIGDQARLPKIGGQELWLRGSHTWEAS